MLTINAKSLTKAIREFQSIKSVRTLPCLNYVLLCGDSTGTYALYTDSEMEYKRVEVSGSGDGYYPVLLKVIKDIARLSTDSIEVSQIAWSTAGYKIREYKNEYYNLHKPPTSCRGDNYRFNQCPIDCPYFNQPTKYTINRNRRGRITGINDDGYCSNQDKPHQGYCIRGYDTWQGKDGENKVIVSADGCTWTLNTLPLDDFPHFERDTHSTSVIPYTGEVSPVKPKPVKQEVRQAKPEPKPVKPVVITVTNSGIDLDSMTALEFGELVKSMLVGG